MLTVSVIIPTRNRLQWLKEAVASVQRQTMSGIECIVVDNGSTDGTDEWCASVPVTYIANPGDPTNIGAARNLGVMNASAPYLLFLDDDDVLDDGALETIYLALAKRSGLVGVYGSPWLMDESSRPINGGAPIGWKPPGPYLYLKDMVANINAVTPPGCALVRRAAFDTAGGFDTTGTIRESVDFIARMLRQGPMLCIPQAVIGYRQHGGQVSLIRNRTGQLVATEARLQQYLVQLMAG